MDTQEIDGRINALAQQRNAAMDQVVIIAGQIAVKDAKIAELEASLKEYEKEEVSAPE